ncbi:hypothetical protein [Mesorhizobium metallidurans]|uniref:hypothetical protein n=1 Tax=Mesorhizobium metallidurans TaxID=489722 RepID=UPI0012F7F638|nr:hypothetical protein [Mesorhizobium metallidurans]
MTISPSIPALAQNALHSSVVTPKIYFRKGSRAKSTANADPRHSIGKCNPVSGRLPETTERIALTGPCVAGFWPMTAQRPGSIDAMRRAGQWVARGSILQPSRFRAINFVFGHLRPGERNVLDDLSPIL